MNHSTLKPYDGVSGMLSTQRQMGKPRPMISLLNKPTAPQNTVHTSCVAPGPRPRAHRVSSSKMLYGLRYALQSTVYTYTLQVSRPWAPAADILHLAANTFAWLAYACCGFAWR